MRPSATVDAPAARAQLRELDRRAMLKLKLGATLDTAYRRAWEEVEELRAEPDRRIMEP